jgi:TM2 domain-containing membrane protein YozV/predicted RNA-binding Zn-ribbon protein involved in translation (DUF1610 family)
VSDDTLRATCPSCGHSIDVPSKHAGKSGRCKKCGSPVTVPKQVSVDDIVSSFAYSGSHFNDRVDLDIDVQESDDQPLIVDDDPPPVQTFIPTPPKPPETTKVCPFCAETILIDAKKCRHCHEFVDPDLRAANAPNLWNPGIAAVLSLIFPGAGQMYKGQVNVGFMFLIFTIIFYFIFIPIGFVIHILTILDACTGDRKKSRWNAESTEPYEMRSAP